MKSSSPCFTSMSQNVVSVSSAVPTKGMVSGFLSPPACRTETLASHSSCCSSVTRRSQCPCSLRRITKLASSPPQNRILLNHIHPWQAASSFLLSPSGVQNHPSPGSLSLHWSESISFSVYTSNHLANIKNV